MSIEELSKNILTNNPSDQLTALKTVRRALSVDLATTIDVIEFGIVPICVEFLDSDNSDIREESTWILANVASGTSEQTNAVVQAGAIPKLIKLLKTPHKNIADHAVRALGNIAGDGSANRDLVLQAGTLPELIHLVKEVTQIDSLRNAVWAISNLFRYKNPPLSFDIVKQTLSTLAELLFHFEDSEVLASTCWALVYLTDDTEGKIQMVVDSGVVPRMIELLASHQLNVLAPAVRVVGNIVLQDDTQTSTVIDAGCLPQLVNLLSSPFEIVRRESVWVISNITAGNQKQIQAVINAGAIRPLVKIWEKGELKLQEEAAWAKRNIASVGSISQTVLLLQQNILKRLCDLINVDEWETDLPILALDTLTKILHTAWKVGKLKMAISVIKENDGLDHLNFLRNRENSELSQAAEILFEMIMDELQSCTK